MAELRDLRVEAEENRADQAVPHSPSCSCNVIAAARTTSIMQHLE